MERIKADTIDAYIAAFPKPVQKVLEEIRNTIRKVSPQAEECISYAIPTFKLNGKNLVHFAAFNSHIGFYPTPVGAEKFKKELSGYKTGKGSVQFPLDEKMPLDLIRRMTEFRVEEVLKSSKEKKTKKAKSET